MEASSEGITTEPVEPKPPARPSSMLWVEQLRKYVGSGEGLGSEAATEMETKKILLEAYKERQQKAAAAGAIPSFYRKKPSENSAGTKVQRLAKFRFLKKQAEVLLNADDLDTMWVLLRENCSIDEASGTEKMNYEDFCHIATLCTEQIGPKCRKFFSACNFLKFEKDDFGRIAILPFYLYVMRTVSLTQARIDMSELDEDGDGFLQPQEMESYIRGLIPNLAQLRNIPPPFLSMYSRIAAKCILVSGHDMWMLEDLLKQTQGTGINIYTHGEMLPANTYPGLKKYPHLVGNFGGAWQLQKFEFSKFPGPIIVTTNCLIEPRESYKNRIFTMGQVGWNGVNHLTTNNFATVIAKAQESQGFKEDEKPEKFITAGFGRKTVLSVADKILEAVKAGALSRVFVIGGCDGSEGERNYYKDLAVATPKDTAILTLGCGKYRFNKLDLGTLPGLGIPRVLDMGQCNDAYGAIAVASALAKALNTDINSLPISYAISWFEQKAVAVFLTMLFLGVKHIRLGPALPAFVTPNTLKFLVTKFDLKAANVADVKGDLQQMMAGK